MTSEQQALASLEAGEPWVVLWYRQHEAEQKARIRRIPVPMPYRSAGSRISLADSHTPYVRLRPPTEPTRAERRGGTTDFAALQRIRGRAV